MLLIHWNIRGYTSNFEELKVLIDNKNTIWVCLQETYHGYTAPYPPRGYIAELANPVAQCQLGVRALRGVITFIRENVPFHLIDLQTNLEAVAIRLRASKLITVCNLYRTPDEVITVR